MENGGGSNSEADGGYGEGGGDSLLGRIDGKVDCRNRSSPAGGMGASGFGSHGASSSCGATFSFLWDLGRGGSGWAPFGYFCHNRDELDAVSGGSNTLVEYFVREAGGSAYSFEKVPRNPSRT